MAKRASASPDRFRADMARRQTVRGTCRRGHSNRQCTTVPTRSSADLHSRFTIKASRPPAPFAVSANSGANHLHPTLAASNAGDRVNDAVIVTGGAGFIGSNFVLNRIESGQSVVTFDKLTYAGNLQNLEPLGDDPRHRFVQ